MSPFFGHIMKIKNNSYTYSLVNTNFPKWSVLAVIVMWNGLIYIYIFFFRNYISQDSELMAKTALTQLHFILKCIMQDNCMIFMNSILQIP